MPAHCNIEIWNDRTITGWAFDADKPDEPVILFLESGERHLGSVVAREYRSDLADFGTGHCVFKLNLEKFPRGLLDTLRLRVSDTGQVFTRPGSNGTPATNQATRSAFGGLWIDRVDWVDVLRAKQQRGLPEEIALQIFRFVRDGYVVLPGAVPPDVVDRLNQEIERAWQAPDGAGLTMITYLPGGNGPSVLPLDAKQQHGLTKLVDAFVGLEVARVAATAPPVVAFLAAIFGEPPRVIQQLHFTMGSQQPIHKDTAYVKVDTDPMGLAATWLALEDVREGTGELEYYVGSHHAPDYKFGGVNKWEVGEEEEDARFLACLQADAATYGFEKRSFLGKAGDVLIWHADLAHGGAPISRPGQTRRSLVTHYSPASHDPYFLRHVAYRGAEYRGVRFDSEYGDVR